MSEVLRRFYREPVVFLGVLSATATALVSEGVISGPAAIVAVVAITALQRQTVTPNQKVSRRRR